jgi:S-disulfanyl-L-cysteine oxidoreductase SoxD
MRIRTAGLALAGLTVIGVIGPSLLAQDTTRSVWDGVYTEAQARRGEAAYRLNCARCHGAALEGIETAGPLTGARFTANWNGVTVGDLMERVKVSMPNDRPGTLSRPLIADVLAYVFSVNRFPAGKTELARQTELLKQIKFEATRPAARN